MDRCLNNLYKSLEAERPVQEVKRNILSCFPDFKIIAKYHPLGFYAFTLGKLDDIVTVRLHVWPVEAKVQNENLLIHNHVFNFKSLVLFGAITNKTYTVQESNEGDGNLFKVEYFEKGSRLTKLAGNYRLLPPVITQVSEGQYYSVMSTEFHESLNTGKRFSVTILYTKSVSNSTPLVFGKNFKEDSIEFERNELPVDEFDSIKNKVVEVLQT
ncbi:MAG: hypothetical protein ACJ75B_11580 [Flavisolibacter sp.]